MTSALLLLLLVPAVTGISFSRTLGSNMVLQRAPQSAEIFGFGTPGDQGKVQFGDHVLPFTINGGGSWAVNLPPTPAGGPFTINATASDGSVFITGVLFGEVWFCGGQSNMGVSVKNVFNSTAEVAAMTTANYPTVRIFHVATRYWSATPFADLEPGQVGLPWSALSPEVGGPFSAVCWFMGRELYEKLGKQVPVGLIQNQWGGTSIKAWSSPDAVAQCPNHTNTSQESYVPFKPVQTVEPMTFDPPLVGDQNDLSVLYNAMVAPYLNMRLAGWAWFQGEEDCGPGRNYYKGGVYYSCAINHMIADWRAKFHLPEAPFIFVQLSAWCYGPSRCNVTSPVYNYDTFIPDMRIGQMGALQQPRVGYAISDDHGDIDSPGGSVHSRDKQPVGHRLAAAAIHFTVDSSVNFGGPRFVSAKVGAGTVIVTVNATSALALTTQQCPQGIQTAFCTGAGFEVSVNGTTWELATGVALGPGSNDITVRVPLQQPQWIRYKYADWPLNFVYDKDGFPLSVFLEKIA